LPDIFFRTGFSTSDLLQYGQKEKQLIPLNALIENHAPDLTAIFRQLPSIRAQSICPDGNIYFLPGAIFQPQMFDCPRPWIHAGWVEKLGLKMPETLDAAELQLMCRSGELGECILEGPLSFDIAISSESASIKGFESEISGKTDILLVPNITVGNVLAKGLIYWAGAKMAGCVLGAKVPIVLASRGATTEEKLLSIMLSIS